MKSEVYAIEINSEEQLWNRIVGSADRFCNNPNIFQRHRHYFFVPYHVVLCIIICSMSPCIINPLKYIIVNGNYKESNGSMVNFKNLSTFFN